MCKDNRLILETHLKEYEMMKFVQTKRIGFRDNLLYVMLAINAAIGAAFISNKAYHEVLLVLPVAAFIIGWAYLVNDLKVSEINYFIKKKLSKEVVKIICEPAFIWEIKVRESKHRKYRKFIQLFADLLTFFGAGLAALITYYNDSKYSDKYIPLICIEVLLLIVLLVGFVWLWWGDNHERYE